MEIIKSEIYKSSLKKINVQAFRGKTVLITGATGMIGSCLVDALMHNNITAGVGCHVVAVGRKEKSAKERFVSYWDSSFFSFVEHDVSNPISGFPEHVDYIIHAASNADPVSFAKTPVDVLLSNVLGVENLMRYGLANGMERLLYISSGEMYGQPNDKMDDFVEDYCGPIDYSVARACYPAGKRAAEVLCQSYSKQYGADIVIVRPCHIYGPTMTRKDSRAVSEFLWSAVDGRDISLKSAGLVERSQCYVLDAVNAILTVLAKGKCGEAYNIADKNNQMLIRDFAQLAAKAGNCKVVFENPSDIEVIGYSKISRAVLDASKLGALGWVPDCAEQTGIEDTIAILKELEN